MVVKRIFQIHWIITLAITLLIGLTAGLTSGYVLGKKSTFPGITPVSELNPGLTTVKLMEVKNGVLKGRISGQRSRIAYSANDILEIEPEESFEIPLKNIRLKDFYAYEDLPEGTQFISSKNGKYYYSILDSRAFNISKANRLHFQNRHEAENAGFQPR